MLGYVSTYQWLSIEHAARVLTIALEFRGPGLSGLLNDERDATMTDSQLSSARYVNSCKVRCSSINSTNASWGLPNRRRYSTVVVMPLAINSTLSNRTGCNKIGGIMKAIRANAA